jgi:hypothetical protein
MHALTVMLTPIPDGWAITLSDGGQTASFTGLRANVARCLPRQPSVPEETRDVC